jgi:membrane-bound ClpP family serine protease
MMQSRNLLKFKIMGTICVLVGIFIIAKFKLHLVGLVLLFIGFYLAMKKGMKP